MKTTIKYTDIVSRSPCYDPAEIGMSKYYKGTIPEFIKEYRSKVKDKQDIFWVVLSDEYTTKNEFLEFSLFCAERVKHLMQDERSLNALRVLALYLHYKATEDELKTAATAAYAAADAADAAANNSDCAATAQEAWAAWAAYAAADAADADTNAFSCAATAVSCAVSCAAANAAADAMRHEKDAQIDKLIEIFEKRKTL